MKTYIIYLDGICAFAIDLKQPADLFLMLAAIFDAVMILDVNGTIIYNKSKFKIKG